MCVFFTIQPLKIANGLLFFVSFLEVDNLSTIKEYNFDSCVLVGLFTSNNDKVNGRELFLLRI